jgi:6-pyruvoyl-tetrahydropterin synthase
MHNDTKQACRKGHGHQFYLHDTTVGNQGGEGMACSPNALAVVAVGGEEV